MMLKIKLLTDGMYKQCTPCVGQVVEATEFSNKKGTLKGYDVTVKELRHIGANLDDQWQDDDTLYFSLNIGALSDIPPECEVVDE